jgi:hypothetical protein
LIRGEIEVVHPGFPFPKPYRNLTAIRLSSGPLGDCWFLPGSSQQLAGFAHALPSLGITILGRNDAGILARSGPDKSSVQRLIAEAGCAPLPPSRVADGVERLCILAPSNRQLTALVRELSSAVGAARILSCQTVDFYDPTLTIPLGSLLQSLSHRQLKAVMAAVDRGYYEIPRRATAEAFAADLGISRSTAEEHLRKGEGTIVGAVAASVAKTPEAIQFAKKTRGRPRKRAPVKVDGLPRVGRGGFSPRS